MLVLSVTISFVVFIAVMLFRIHKAEQLCKQILSFSLNYYVFQSKYREISFYEAMKGYNASAFILHIAFNFKKRITIDDHLPVPLLPMYYNLLIDRKINTQAMAEKWVQFCQANGIEYVKTKYEPTFIEWLKTKESIVSIDKRKLESKNATNEKSTTNN